MPNINRSITTPPEIKSLRSVNLRIHEGLFLRSFLRLSRDGRFRPYENQIHLLRSSTICYDPGGIYSPFFSLSDTEDDKGTNPNSTTQNHDPNRSRLRHVNNDQKSIQHAAVDYICYPYADIDRNNLPQAVNELLRRMCDSSDPIYHNYRWVKIDANNTTISDLLYRNYMWVEINDWGNSWTDSGDLLWIYSHKYDFWEEKSGMDSKSSIVNVRRLPGFYSNPKCANLILEIMGRDVKSHPPDLYTRKRGCYMAGIERLSLKLVWSDRSGCMEVDLWFGGSRNCKRPKKMYSNVLCVGVLRDNQEIPVNIILNHIGI